MIGWFEAGRNWARKRELKKQWLLALRYMRGPGRGLDVPAHDVVAAVALEELLKEHPELTVERYRDNVTLCYRQDFAGIAAPETYNHLDRAGFLARAGDELVPQAELRQAELRAKGLLPDDPSSE